MDTSAEESSHSEHHPPLPPLPAASQNDFNSPVVNGNSGINGKMTNGCHSGLALDNPGFIPVNEVAVPEVKEGANGDVKPDSDFNADKWSIEDIKECCDGGCSVWCKRYFCEGQMLSKSQTVAMLVTANDRSMPFHERLLVRHRRVIGLLIPGLLVNFFWLAVMIHYDLWHYFIDSYFLSITMVFGSMVAGMTSLGGATIAFPVMTLAFKISPAVARDFGVLIQSFGMGCAAFTINFMKVKIEKKVIVIGSVGGLGGMIFGLHLVDPFVSPAQKKLVFASTLFSFASVLLLLNCQKNRKTFDEIPHFCAWKGLVLLLTGFIGGSMTSFAGCGLDVCCFSVMTLLFRISEKVATPTSVILMGGNSMVGAFWRSVIIEGVQPVAYEYLAVCIPICIIGAPLGAVLGSHFHRLVLAVIIIVIDVVTLVASLIIIPLTPALIGMSAGIIAGACLLFGLLTYAGSRVIATEKTCDKEEKAPDLVHTNPEKGYSSFL